MRNDSGKRGTSANSANVTMSLSKERLRRIHGLHDPTGPADPDVLARRKYQEGAAKWLARWTYRLQAGFAMLGFVVVLLPLFSKSWRGVIEVTPAAGRIFHDFSTLSGWAMVLFASLMAMHLVLNWKVNDFPGGWHPTKRWGFPSPQLVVDLDLYPRVKREEFIFWVSIVFGTAGTTIWLLAFGVMAFFIRMGG